MWAFTKLLVSSLLFLGLECVNSQFTFQWTYTPEQGVAVGAIGRDAAAVVKNGLVYLAYNSGTNLYYAGSADGITFNQPNPTVVFTPGVGGGVARSLFDPSLAYYKNNLYIFWVDFNTIQYSIYDSSTASWGPKSTVPASVIPCGINSTITNTIFSDKLTLGFMCNTGGGSNGANSASLAWTSDGLSWSSKVITGTLFRSYTDQAIVGLPAQDGIGGIIPEQLLVLSNWWGHGGIWYYMSAIPFTFNTFGPPDWYIGNTNTTSGVCGQADINPTTGITATIIPFSGCSSFVFIAYADNSENSGHQPFGQIRYGIYSGLFDFFIPSKPIVTSTGSTVSGVTPTVVYIPQLRRLVIYYVEPASGPLPGALVSVYATI